MNKLQQLLSDLTDLATVNDEWQSVVVVEDAIEMIEKAMEGMAIVPAGFLKVAKCPDINCDGFGTVAVQVSDTEWEPHQCQWCDEKQNMIASIGAEQ